MRKYYRASPMRPTRAANLPFHKVPLNPLIPLSEVHQKAQEPHPGCVSVSSTAAPDCCSRTVSPSTPTPRPTICQVLQAALTRDIQPPDLTGQIAYAAPTIFGGHADVSKGVYRNLWNVRVTHTFS